MRVVERHAAVAFIFSKDNMLLVGNTIKGGAYEGRWIVPGGGIEDGETALDAVIREVREEVGIGISDDFIEEKDVSNGTSEKTLRDTKERVIMKMTFHNFVINIDSNSNDILVKTGDDFTNAKWVAIADLKNTAMPLPSIESLIRFGYIDS